ncbi:uncharacterized protein LOC114537305 [Dendronephthya gigantea]|uniref:uncharacterized protein LOC114537305 n=1 Tax=Dendronephthya gigantea TaxID=151771 RepID=UPI0010691DA4|nr:uncharacterized protein LOC114537305 [Dendronephthya gigantea]
MFESAKKNEGMVDQKLFKTAKRYGFDSVYFDECSIQLLENYIKYVRPLLTPTCEYVLVNRNGKQFQKLTGVFSVLVFEAIGKYIHPTRYRQIIETGSAQVLLPNEQKWISEDQKHSSNVARVHYQKKRSREVAMRGRQCMQKLLHRSVRFKSKEDNCIRLGIAKFGLRWTTILRDPEYHFNACRVPNSLRKRAEDLKLVCPLNVQR